MQYEAAMKWADALESGKYKQGKRALRTLTGFCCLGVLCDITPGVTWGQSLSGAIEYTCFIDGKYNGTALLPNDIAKLYGIEYNVGIGFVREDGSKETLVHMNDSGRSFKEIAAAIREHWEQL